MNVWNARNAMNANKKKRAFVMRLRPFALAFCFLPAFVSVAEAAPSLYGVKEIIVQYAQFTNQKTADSCGLVREEIAALLNAELKTAMMPATPVNEAKPQMLGVARIDLLPEINSVNSQDLDCTSWISLTARSENSLHIPPVDTLRSVTVEYWRKSTVVVTGQSTHLQNVKDALQIMVRQFIKEYRLDQPPEIPAGQ